MDNYNEVFSEAMEKIMERDLEEVETARLEEAKEFLMKRCSYSRGYERTIYREALNDLIRLIK